MTTPPVVIVYPTENVIAGDDTSTPDTAITYMMMADYDSSTENTGSGYSMPYDNTQQDLTPTVDTENLVAGDDTSAPDTALSYFGAAANEYTATLHRSHGKGDYFGNPACDQKRVGSLGSA